MRRILAATWQTWIGELFFFLWLYCWAKWKTTTNDEWREDWGREDECRRLKTESGAVVEKGKWGGEVWGNVKGEKKWKEVGCGWLCGREGEAGSIEMGVDGLQYCWMLCVWMDMRRWVGRARFVDAAVRMANEMVCVCQMNVNGCMYVDRTCC